MLDETTYYFTAFAIDQNNNIIDSETSSITTDFGWHVTPNTLAYYKLEENALDYSENGRNLSNYNVSFTTLNGVKCAYFNGSAYLYLNNNPITGSSNFTAVSRFRPTNASSGGQNTIAFGNKDSTYAFSTWLRYGVLQVGGWNNDRNTGFTVQNNTRYCVAMIHSGGTIKTYVNSTLVNTSSVSYNLQNTKTRIGCGLSGDGDRFTGYIGRCVEETKARTETEYLNFFNKTKSIYGVS